MTARKIEIFVIVVIIALVGIIYAFQQTPVLAPTNDTVTTDQNNQTTPSTNTSVKPGTDPAPPPAQQVPTTTITYQGQDGKNALELLKANHQVEAKHYSFGDLVTGIDGVTPDSKHFWALYINDKFSQVGASSYITKSSDTIKWQMDSIVDTTK